MLMSTSPLRLCCSDVGVALSTPWAVPALAGAAQSNTAMQSHATPPFHNGDLVQLRSGGPVMTAKNVWGDWAICSWWSEEYGEFQSVASAPPCSRGHSHHLQMTRIHKRTGRTLRPLIAYPGRGELRIEEPFEKSA